MSLGKVVVVCSWEWAEWRCFSTAWLQVNKMVFTVHNALARWRWYYTLIIAFVFGFLQPTALLLSPHLPECIRMHRRQVQNKCGQTHTRSHSTTIFRSFLCAKQLKITTYTRFNTRCVRFCGFEMCLKNAFAGRKFINAGFFPTCSLPLLSLPTMQSPLAQCHFMENWTIAIGRGKRGAEGDQSEHDAQQMPKPKIVRVNCSRRPNVVKTLFLANLARANFNYFAIYFVCDAMPFGDFGGPGRSCAVDLLIGAGAAFCEKQTRVPADETWK